MKPVVKQIIPFDADNEHKIEFSWAGSRVYGHKIEIYDNETNEKVYPLTDDEEFTTYALYHTLPAETLINGKKYSVQVSVRDYQEVYSEWSDKYSFKVFSTPEFIFENITEENKQFTSSSVTARVKYLQKEYEDIGSYKFYLYDSNNNVLQISDTKYERDEINYTYKGLDNNTFYYIQCIGVTANGMPIDTGKVKIFIKYENTSIYARFFAENDVQHGGNKWSTNIVLIDYTGNKTFEYVDNDYIDLTNDKIYYDNGYTIPNDGAIIISGKSFYKNNNHILSIYNKDSIYQINLYSYIHDDTTLRFKLVVNNMINNYILYSKPMIFTNDDNIEIRVKKNNDVYSIETYIEGVLVE